MGPTIALGNIVGEAQHVFMEAVVPPQGDVDRDVVLLRMDGNRRFEEARLAAIQITYECLDATFIEQVHFLRLHAAVVGQGDADAGIEEGELTQAVLKRRKIELGHGERVRRRQERNLRAGARLVARVIMGCVTRDGQRTFAVAMDETHFVGLAITPDGEIKADGQRIHHRHAHAMQATGHLVGVLVEFPARVQLGHDDFGGGHAFFGVHLGGNAAAIVAHGNRPIRIEGDVHRVAMAGQRFVDGVVHHLIDHVMKPRAVIGVADIHARTLAHGIKALEDLDAVGAIFIRVRGFVAHGLVFHSSVNGGNARASVQSSLMLVMMRETTP